MTKRLTLALLCCLLGNTTIFAQTPNTPSSTAPQSTPVPAPTANPTSPTTPPLMQHTVPTDANNSNHKTGQALTPAQIQQKHKQELDAKQQRLTALELANQQALSQNQELQLKNDNLIVQIQVLQSERSAQMFIYGAITIAIGAAIGFLIGMFIFTRNQRRRF